jgi:ATP-binding cassette subfamily C (CFTR/MRP) protein 4
MANGRIECAGSYQECFKAREKSLADPTEPEHEELSEPVMDIDAKEVLDRMEANESSSIASEGETDTEVSATGTVTMNTYINYMKAMPSGLSACFLLLLVFCATQGSALAAMTFIGKWSRLPAKEQWSASIIGPVFGAVISVGVFALVRAAMFFHLTIMASKRLHDDMTKSMIRAKLEFFDTNPLGRILNRFSADVGVADDQLPVAMFDFLFILFMVIGAFVSALFILPLTTIFLPPLVWYFLRVRRAFLTTSLELKRIEGIARSPIFNCLSECLDGITTIRSNDAIDYFQKKFMKVHDVHSRSFFAFIACERWLAFRMDAVMMVFTTIVSFTAVIINDTGFVRTDPGVLGLAICLLLQLPLLFQYMIRQSAQVVNNMVSVDRVLQFRDLPAEAAFTNEYDNGVSNEWPHTGTLDIQDLSVRYQDDLPLSLHSLSFQIDGGSRVGKLLNIFYCPIEYFFSQTRSPLLHLYSQE